MNIDMLIILQRKGHRSNKVVNEYISKISYGISPTIERFLLYSKASAIFCEKYTSPFFRCYTQPNHAVNGTTKDKILVGGISSHNVTPSGLMYDGALGSSCNSLAKSINMQLNTFKASSAQLSSCMPTCGIGSTNYLLDLLHVRIMINHIHLFKNLNLPIKPSRYRRCHQINIY